MKGRASKQALALVLKSNDGGPHRFPEMERGQKDQPGTAELREGGQRSLQRVESRGPQRRQS